MISFSKALGNLVLLLGAALVGLLVDVSTAYAQANTCARLQNSLAALDRNSDFRQFGNNSSAIRNAQREVQRAESAYVREGCNADAKAGRPLNRQCRTLASRVLEGRANVENLQKSVGTGNAVSQQREAILQEMSRFGCDGRSRVTRNARGNLFDQLFDMLGGGGSGDQEFDGEGGFREEQFNPYGNYHTVRTLCVRKSDGFYWPISYSTLTDYIANDAEQCRAQCPGLDVDLYYYDNPGQEPEQMVNTYGQPYSALPTAFRFRTDFDRESSCKANQVDYGAITLAQTADGQSRAMLSLGGVSVPLPLRDPRQRINAVAVTPVAVAEYVSVPLPRRRPAAPGEEPKPVAVVAARTNTNQPERIVQFGDKRVRVVGPETPYVPEAAAGI